MAMCTPPIATISTISARKHHYSSGSIASSTTMDFPSNVKARRKEEYVKNNYYIVTCSQLALVLVMTIFNRHQLHTILYVYCIGGLE